MTDPASLSAASSAQQAALDKDGPPLLDAGLFGLDVDRHDALIVAIPAPFEATVSYRTGTAQGPEAIRVASHQIDLFDLDSGDLEAARVHLQAANPAIATEDAAARPLVERVLDALTHGQVPSPEWIADVNARCKLVHDALKVATADVIRADQIPCVIGGEHSVAFGPIAAAIESTSDTIGVLQVDAHADLRVAYEGFEFSHASVMHNVLAHYDAVKLVQVGIRDVSAAEVEAATSDPRVHFVADRALRPARLSGKIVEAMRDAVAPLPHKVWLSIDIDGLDPALCPHTGTPVPGGLSFDEFVVLLEAVVDSGREIIGMDLSEVAPGPADAPNGEWDATVGARALAKMCGFASKSRALREAR